MQPQKTQDHGKREPCRNAKDVEQYQQHSSKMKRILHTRARTILPSSNVAELWVPVTLKKALVPLCHARSYYDFRWLCQGLAIAGSTGYVLNISEITLPGTRICPRSPTLNLGGCNLLWPSVACCELAVRRRRDWQR